jgi:hypothetical protein
MPKSPLALVKERFQDKAKLVAAVQALATDELWNGDRLNEDKGLTHVSNKKLLHLHDVLSQVKKDHGSRAKLIAAIADGFKRGKDEGFRSGLEKRSTPELAQLLNASQRRTKAAQPKPEAPKAAAPKAAAGGKKPVAKKAAAKKPAAKKAAAKKPAAKKKAAKKKK